MCVYVCEGMSLRAATLNVFLTMISGQKSFKSVTLDNWSPDMGASKAVRAKLFNVGSSKIHLEVGM